MKSNSSKHTKKTTTLLCYKPIDEVTSKTALNTNPLILNIFEDSVAFESIVRMLLVRVLSRSTVKFGRYD
jgi:hypothetical protein